MTVSITPVADEVPGMVGLRLFLPENWMSDPTRMSPARATVDRQVARSKPEIDGVRNAGVQFECVLSTTSTASEPSTSQSALTNPSTTSSQPSSASSLERMKSTGLRDQDTRFRTYQIGCRV